MSKLKIIWLILKERRHQNKIWGADHDRKHTPGEWCNIIENYNRKYIDGAPEQDEHRLIQIAAICMAAIEAGD